MFVLQILADKKYDVKTKNNLGGIALIKLQLTANPKAQSF